MDRNSFSYFILSASALGSFAHLSWMTHDGKFTFSLIGIVFITLYSFLNFSEYKPLALGMEMQSESHFDDNERSIYNCTTDEDSDGNTNSLVTPNATYVQYRQFSPSRHHRLSSHHMEVDSTQPDCDSTKNPSLISNELVILEFCVYLLSTSFFSTDLFFAYQVFAPELNYLPLLGGLLNIIPALYIGNAKSTRDLYIFTIPANCWGQIYYAGYKNSNFYAMFAGYFFFVAYYYNDLQKSFRGITPQSQTNYYMSNYCVCSSLALHLAFSKFDK